MLAFHRRLALLRRPSIMFDAGTEPKSAPSVPAHCRWIAAGRRSRSSPFPGADGLAIRRAPIGLDALFISALLRPRPRSLVKRPRLGEFLSVNRGRIRRTGEPLRRGQMAGRNSSF